MTNETIFDSWAPRDALWSPWVKPILFACPESVVDGAPMVPPVEPWDTSWAPGAKSGTVILLDLPGALGVRAGLRLARNGYRPVPLFNAMPLPLLPPPWKNEDIPVGGRDRGQAVVELRPTVTALREGATELADLNLPNDAPPVFLIDWDRNTGNVSPTPGVFDNRSVSFTTDFPSANFLLAHGLNRVVLVQPTPAARPWVTNPLKPQADLAHTLLRWQDAGLSLELRHYESPTTTSSFELKKPSWFGWACQRIFAGFGLRRHALGGFGGWVPDASSG